MFCAAYPHLTEHIVRFLSQFAKNIRFNIVYSIREPSVYPRGANCQDEVFSRRKTQMPSEGLIFSLIRVASFAFVKERRQILNI